MLTLAFISVRNTKDNHRPSCINNCFLFSFVPFLKILAKHCNNSFSQLASFLRSCLILAFLAHYLNTSINKSVFHVNYTLYQDKLGRVVCTWHVNDAVVGESLCPWGWTWFSHCTQITTGFESDTDVFLCHSTCLNLLLILGDFDE